MNTGSQPSRRSVFSLYKRKGGQRLDKGVGDWIRGVVMKVGVCAA